MSSTWTISSAAQVLQSDQVFGGSRWSRRFGWGILLFEGGWRVIEGIRFGSSRRNRRCHRWLGSGTCTRWPTAVGRFCRHSRRGSEVRGGRDHEDGVLDSGGAAEASRSSPWRRGGAIRRKGRRSGRWSCRRGRAGGWCAPPAEARAMAMQVIAVHGDIDHTGERGGCRYIRQCRPRDAGRSRCPGRGFR